MKTPGNSMSSPALAQKSSKGVLSYALAGLGFAAVLVYGTGAFAQAKAKAGGAAAPQAGGEDNVQYKAKTVYDFDDDTVEGDLQRPDGVGVDAIRKVKHNSLIEIRKDFIPEMLKSLEDV